MNATLKAKLGDEHRGNLVAIFKMSPVFPLSEH